MLRIKYNAVRAMHAVAAAEAKTRMGIELDTTDYLVCDQSAFK